MSGEHDKARAAVAAALQGAAIEFAKLGEMFLVSADDLACVMGMLARAEIDMNNEYVISPADFEAAAIADFRRVKDGQRPIPCIVCSKLDTPRSGCTGCSGDGVVMP